MEWTEVTVTWIVTIAAAGAATSIMYSKWADLWSARQEPCRAAFNWALVSALFQSAMVLTLTIVLARKFILPMAMWFLL